MDDWLKFLDFEEDENVHMFKHVGRHAEFVAKIIEENPEKIIEIGCGTGTMSIFLSNYLKKCEVVGIDNNKKVIEKAKEINSNIDSNVKFLEMDAFNLKFEKNKFDLTFSQGFFEHFNNEEILNLIEEQLRIADKVIFSVPSNFYPSKDFGNERLLSLNEWFKILENYKVNGFRYGKRIGTLVRAIRKFDFSFSYMIKFLFKRKRPHLCIKVEK